MKLNFSILNQEIDITGAIKDEKSRIWWWKNARIPEDTKIENLTDAQKKALIKLAIYEGYMSEESTCNLADEYFELINKPVTTTNEQPKISDFEDELKNLSKKRCEDEKDNNGPRAYVKDVLDSYNFLKLKLG